MFIANLFMFMTSTKFDEKDRDDDTAEASVELERRIEVEPRYKKYYMSTTLNTFISIIMPFFPPIPVKDWERTLEPIKELLKKVVNEKGLYYQEYDVQWSHFGYRYDGNKMVVTLLNSGSMDSFVQDIDAQVDEMKKMTDEELAEPTYIIMKGSS